MLRLFSSVILLGRSRRRRRHRSPFLNGAFDPVPALHAGDQQQVPAATLWTARSAKPCPARSTSIGPARAEFDQSGENGLRNEACDRARERYGLPPLPVPLPLSLPETTIVEEIGVVQFAGATAAWNRVQSPTDLSLFSRRQGVCMPITANALYRDSFNFYATNWPAS